MRLAWLLLLAAIALGCGRVSGWLVAPVVSRSWAWEFTAAMCAWTIAVGCILSLVTWLWLQSLHRIWEEEYLKRRGAHAQRCLNCGYTTSALPTAQCPECGEAWNRRPSWSLFPRVLITQLVWWPAWFAGFASAWIR